MGTWLWTWNYALFKVAQLVYSTGAILCLEKMSAVNLFNTNQLRVKFKIFGSQLKDEWDIGRTWDLPMILINIIKLCLRSILFQESQAKPEVITHQFSYRCKLPKICILSIKSRKQKNKHPVNDTSELNYSNENLVFRSLKQGIMVLLGIQN